VFQAIADHRNAGADLSTINHLLGIIFPSEEFVQHTPTYATQQLAFNVAAHFELLKDLSNAPDLYVQLNLKKQVEQRSDLQNLKIKASHPKREQEELQFIKDELNSITKSIGVAITANTPSGPDTIAEFDDGFLIVGNNLLRIYLTETEPKENIEGIIYCERTYDLDLTPPSLHLNEDDHKEREISSIM